MDADRLEVGKRVPPPGAVLRVLSENVSHLLHGEPPSKPPRSMRLRETTTMPAVQGGWVLLRERPSEELALVLVGKFWRAR